MRLPRRRCATCRYQYDGECRRWPPDGHGWPVVVGQAPTVGELRDHWCGEWQPVLWRRKR